LPVHEIHSSGNVFVLHARGVTLVSVNTLQLRSRRSRLLKVEEFCDLKINRDGSSMSDLMNYSGYGSGGGYFGVIGDSVSFAGGAYGLSGNYTVSVVAPGSNASLPEVTISANAWDPSRQAVDTVLGGLLARQLGVAGSELALGIAGELIVGAEAGAWAGPLGGLIGAAIGGAYGYYMVTHQ
jgi:hypothetical protein